MPVGWNIQRDATNTKWGSGRFKRMSRSRKRRFLMDGIVRRIPVTLNMILGQLKASWRGQR